MNELTKHKITEIYTVLSQFIPFNNRMVILCEKSDLSSALVIETITHEFGHYFSPPKINPDLGELVKFYAFKYGSNLLEYSKQLDINERYARSIDAVSREMLGMDTHHVFLNQKSGLYKTEDLDQAEVVALATKISEAILICAFKRKWPKAWFQTVSNIKRLKTISIKPGPEFVQET